MLLIYDNPPKANNAKIAFILYTFIQIIYTFIHNFVI